LILHLHDRKGALLSEADTCTLQKKAAEGPLKENLKKKKKKKETEKISV